jgi:hypothetical protein
MKRAVASMLLACLLSQVAWAEDSCAVGPWPAGVPDGSIELAEFPIMDLTLSKPDKPMPWGSVLAPAGWKSSPGMRWSQRESCARDAQNSRWTVEASDGSARISVLPQEYWKVRTRWGNQGTASSCEIRPYTSTDAFLLDLAGRLASSARDKTPRDRPDILGARSPEDAMRARLEMFEEGVSAAELRFTFESKDGPRDAILISIVTITGTAPGIPERDTHGSSAPSLFASFPAGRLDARLVETIRRSFVANSNWSWSQWQKRMRDLKLEPLDEKMREAMIERSNDVRPVGKSYTFGGLAFTATSAPDVWRNEAGRYFQFPEGALPPACTGS